MKLGITIPTYDNLEMLKRLVKQIYDFTSGDFIICVVEDGQKESTRNWLVKTQISNTNFFPIFHEVNRGVAPSWNDGLQLAVEKNCTHFAFFNDDIELPPDWWDTCKKEFSDTVHLVSTTKPRMQTKVMQGWFFIFDKVSLEKVGKFDEQFAPFYNEDTDFIRRYIMSKLEYKLCDVDIIHHESTTITHNIKANNPAHFWNVWESTNRKIQEKFGATWQEES